MGQVEIHQEATIRRIQQILDQLQPYIQSHGGKVELVKLHNAIVYIRFYGACVQCPLSFYTVTYGIERHIKQAIPEITAVEVVDE